MFSDTGGTGKILAQIESITNVHLDNLRVDTDEHGYPCARVCLPGVVGVSISGNRISLTRQRKANHKAFGLHRKREQVGGFSRSSGYRMASYLRSCEAEYRALLTLTFEEPTSGKVAKQCFERFRHRLWRVYGKVAGYSAFWFLEFQERGVPHFHLLSTHYIPKKWLSAAWLDSCRSGTKNFTNIKSLNSGRFGAISYAKKYARKQSQKVIPPDFGWSGRFWGKIGNNAVAAASIKLDFNALNCPKTASKLQKLDDFIRDCEKKNAVRRRDIQVIDKVTKELKYTGVTLWEWNKGFYLRKLYQLVNELIEEPENKLKLPRGWINGEQIRQGSKK